jgi:NAD(P)H-nitrite reductase large subunit
MSNERIIFSADMLLVHLMGEGAEQRRQMLGDFDQPVNADNEAKAWAFLETRAQLLLRAYPTTAEVCSCQYVANSSRGRVKLDI